MKENGEHENVLNSQCQDCGLKSEDTDSGIWSYCCLKRDWRKEDQNLPSNLRLYAYVGATPEIMGINLETWDDVSKTLAEADKVSEK